MFYCKSIYSYGKLTCFVCSNWDCSCSSQLQNLGSWASDILLASCDCIQQTWSKCHSAASFHTHTGRWWV